jgi:hypothetical protein
LTAGKYQHGENGCDGFVYLEESHNTWNVHPRVPLPSLEAKSPKRHLHWHIYAIWACQNISISLYYSDLRATNEGKLMLLDMGLTS